MIKSWILCALIMISMTVVAQSSKSSAADKKDVTETVEALYKAMVEKDGKSLEKLTAESLSYGHSSGTLENKSEYIDAVLKGPFDFISIDPAEQSIYFSEGTAIVRHFFVAKGINDGEPADVRIGALLVFQKQNGQWKLLARQAYKL